ncbi:MAG: hypothetical protein QXJ68_04100 [Methanocellales archaeon]
MLQTILILFAAGAVGGLTIGRRVAMSEVEMMWRLSKSGVKRRNKVWDEVKEKLKKQEFKKNKRWEEVKATYRNNEIWNKTKRDFEAIKADLKKNERWDTVKANLKDWRKAIDEKERQRKLKWENIKQEAKYRDKYRVSSSYLVIPSTNVNDEKNNIL